MPPSLTGIRSLWQVLGADSRAQAGINMISGIGSGLADNALRDWLGQSSNSKFQFSSNGTGSADILLPLWEGTNNLLFSQIGIRRNSERTTYNVGSGLRHFIDDGWMLGINGFWDYDLTGDNSRLGLGIEGWADYLKLSANGYFRLTQWHQSPLGVMEDYDERPANGFDVNAQAWLPAYPQLGGALKYEKYFGKGVILNDSTSVSSLKDSPSAITTEINYTPFPLLTLSAGHKAGTISENYASIAFSYRTGVSLRDQIDPRTVGIMRSLSGSRYDFVDRNYNIVMQYRKQDLIAFSLPASVTGEAMTTLSIDASVRAKYGLKDIHWEAPELISAGGKIQKTSPTSLSVTLPAYLGEGNNGWRVTAIATDTHGNAAPQQETLINVIRSSNTVHLTEMPAGSIVANGIDEGKATALLTDKAGAPLSNMTVKFTLSGPSEKCIINDAATCEATLSSNSAGEVSVRFRSTTAGNYQLLAAMENGNSDSKTVSFIGDVTTAKIDSLAVVKDNAVADGVATDILRVTVVDAYDNRLADQPVALRADMRLVLPAKSVTTGSEGTADIAVTSTTATSADVTATLGTSTANATLTFIADRSTARINMLQVVNNNAIANGLATGSLRVIVHDAHGNSVAGQEVALQAAKGLKLTAASVTTGIDGSAIITATSRVATTMSITASVGASSASADLTFMGDTSTAQVSALTVLNDNAIADGLDTVDLQVTVTDAWGNPLAEQVVTPEAVNDLKLSDTRVITGIDGLATFSVTSQVAAAAHVSASLGGTSAQATVHFIADARTARIDSLEVLTNNSVADGNIRNALRVIVNDAYGNRLAGQKVDLHSDKRLIFGADSVITGSEGSAIITATSLTAATYEITASLADSTANASITFIADTRTARISELLVSSDNAVANGTATNILQVLVNDVMGNALANMKVQLTAENGVSLSNRVVTTGVDGRATFTATSRIASAFTIAASLGESSENASATVHFVADSSTAHVTALTVTADNVVADGVARAALRVTVQDKNGNPVPNQSVALSADTGLILQASDITTGSDGTATFTTTSTVAAGLNVTASVGESSLSTKVNFIADASTAEITALAVTTDNVVANGAAKAALKITVRDKNGNPLAGQKVSLNADKPLTLSADTVITGSDGTAIFTATSTTATTSNIRATLGESVRNASVTFIGDVTTAQITALMVTTDNVVADGAAKAALHVTVQDKHGNLLADQKISLSADKALTLSAATVTTAKDGTATFTATSTTAATFPVRAALGDSVRNANVSFIGDITTAHVSALKVTTNNAVANGMATAALRVTVQDKHGNLLADQKVALTAAEKGVTLSAAGVTTAKDGTATFTATSTTAATYSISAGLGDSSQSARVTFIADASTAGISDLTVTTDNVLANGTAKAQLSVTVKDQHGNLLANQKVTLSTADKGVTLSTTSVTTGKDGTATFAATSTTAAAYDVSATLGNSSRTATVTFIADASTAGISDLTVTTDNVLANGKARAQLSVTVKDQHGNPLADQKVTLTAKDSGITLSAASVTTTKDGTATFTATSTLAAAQEVSATLGNSSRTAIVTFIADVSTAQVSDLKVTTDNVVANGTARAALRVTVQ
ncbi:Ig-like domain-containing protein, partial [Erwinia tasmaniensis]|uniref:Ig-like domain-containing protein n=1 Tax=Erwinia tasmaniensis TaxID=338565 RepID=UPI003A4DEF19